MYNMYNIYIYIYVYMYIYIVYNIYVYTYIILQENHQPVLLLFAIATNSANCCHGIHAVHGLSP